jgi:predicted RNA-binding protein YlxR (DUF448 family)
MAIKKVPKRRCIACNEQKDKRDLLRIVRGIDGEISVDTTGKKNGRGAYICRDKKCLELAKKTKKLEKTFETNIGDDIYQHLAREIEHNEQR